MNNVKAVIFDFNGVLWWDTHLHAKAWKDFSKQIRGTELSDEEISDSLGRTNKSILEYLLGREISSDELLEYTEGKESAYRQLCIDLNDDFKLSPGASELLDYLKNENIPITIATGSEINNLKFFWDNLGLSKWFNFDTIAFDDGTMKGKPNPDIYLKAANNLGSEPQDCMVVEDAVSGIRAAFNAGIGVIVAIGPKNKHELLKNIDGVNLVISDFYDLMQLFKTSKFVHKGLP